MKKIVSLFIGVLFATTMFASENVEEVKFKPLPTECVVEEFDEFYTDCPGGGEYISSFFYGQAVYDCQTGELLDYNYEFVDAPPEMRCPQEY